MFNIFFLIKFVFSFLFFSFLGQNLSANQMQTNIKWKQHANTIAGGNGKGKQLNQLCDPYGIYVDDDHQTIYIADHGMNHRIVEWKFECRYWIN